MEKDTENFADEILIEFSENLHLINPHIRLRLGCRVRISIIIFFQAWIWTIQGYIIAIFGFERFYTSYKDSNRIEPVLLIRCNLI